MSTLEDRQRELQNRIAAIDSELADCDAQFLVLASQFNSTDSTNALKAAETIERKLEVLRREKTLALASQGHINKLMMDAKAEQAEQERRVLAAQAKEIAEGVVTLNAEIDDHLIKARQLFERRAALLHQLGSIGALDSSIVNKLGKNANTRACCAARLHAHISLEKTSTHAAVPLSSTNPVLLNIGKHRPPTNGSGEEAS
jgi:hypothetical protein